MLTQTHTHTYSPQNQEPLLWFKRRKTFLVVRDYHTLS